MKTNMKYAKLAKVLLLLSVLECSSFASAQTEFPTQREIQQMMSESERLTHRRLEANKSRPGGGAFPVVEASHIAITDMNLQTDEEMMRRYAEIKATIKRPDGVDKAAIVPVPVKGTLLEQCRLIAQELAGGIHANAYGGVQRIFQCGNAPLLMVFERALKSGNEITLVVREQANTSLSVSGKERGAILWRTKSRRTGNGHSSLSWRDGDKIVTLSTNSSNDDAVAWMRKIAESL